MMCGVSAKTATAHMKELNLGPFRERRERVIAKFSALSAQLRPLRGAVRQPRYHPLQRARVSNSVAHERKRRQQFRAAEQSIEYDLRHRWAILRDPVEDTLRGRRAPERQRQTSIVP
jgi:hypothetical protein